MSDKTKIKYIDNVINLLSDHTIILITPLIDLRKDGCDTHFNGYEDQYLTSAVKIACKTEIFKSMVLKNLHEFKEPLVKQEKTKDIIIDMLRVIAESMKNGVMPSFDHIPDHDKESVINLLSSAKLEITERND
jgi:hypothetical protein